MSSMFHAAKMLQTYWGSNDNYDIYEFGLYVGNTATELFTNLKNMNCHYNCYHGFDSFIGFPPNNEGFESWETGKMSIADDYQCNDVEKNKETWYNAHNTGFIPIKLIAGYYSELKDGLVKQSMLPASFIHIDSDLYVSARDALDFMARNNLIVKNTILLYDDWAADDNGYGRDAEGKAHKEIAEKYNLNWQFLDSQWLDKTMNNSFILR